jgi:hypothetical protein
MEKSRLGWIARLSSWRRSSAPSLRLLGCLCLALALLIAPLALVVIAKQFGADYELGLKVAQLVYSWPVVTGVCIVVFLMTFRNPLSTLICGQWRIKAGSVEFESQRVLLQTNLDPRKGEIGWEEWGIEIAKKLSPVEHMVLTELGQKQKQAFDHVVRRWWFEKTWGIIYGTQVVLLEHISKSETGAVGTTVIFNLFDAHVGLLTSTWPDRAEVLKTDEQKQTYLRQWLGFLESSYLIEVNASGAARTELTGPFMDYLREQGYTRQMRIF